MFSVNDKYIKEEKVEMYDSEGVHIQWLLSKNEGSTVSTMRKYTIKSKGKIPFHNHPWEHIIYVLKGTCEVLSGDTTTSAKSGDAIFIPEYEKHAYVNNSDDDFVFLCIIPNEGDKR